MANSKKLDSNILNAILYIAVGILFCIFRSGLLGWLMTIVGIIFVINGVIRFINSDMVAGIVSAVIGVVVILGGWLFVDIVLLVFGILVIIKGVTDLIDAVKSKVTANIITACVTLAVGILLIISKWALMDLLFIILGVIFIANGVLSLLGKELIKK